MLITDAEERWVLAACRGLKQAGYRVAAVAGQRPAVAHWSVDCDERLRAPDPHRDEVRFAEALERILSGHDYAMLLPGAEASMVAASNHRDRLEPFTKLGLPPKDVVQRGYDKVVLLRQAAAAALPSPESVVCRDRREAMEAVRRIGFPIMIKPARSQLRDGFSRRRRHQPSQLFADETAFVKALPRFGLPIILQRYQRSAFVLSVSGVVAEGHLLAVAASRYLRTWPPFAGSSSLAVSVEPPPEVVRKIEEFLQGMGWQGVFEAELLGGRDRPFELIDFNPRLYGSLALAIEAGANLPAIWCDWVLGRNPSPVVARAGLRYRWEEGEAYNLVRRFSHGDLRSAASIVRSEAPVVHAVFRASDPAPLIAATLRALSIWLLRAAHRIRSSSRRRALGGSVEAEVADVVARPMEATKRTPDGVPSTTLRPSG